MNISPDGRGIESVIGLKDSLPENAIAVTIVGEARKFIVLLLPSLRDLKLLFHVSFVRPVTQVKRVHTG